MITGTIRNQVDAVWNAFWSGGISNPLTVIEQITYLLFMRRLDELQTKKEQMANLSGKPLQNPTFGVDQNHLRCTVQGVRSGPNVDHGAGRSFSFHQESR